MKLGSNLFAALASSCLITLAAPASGQPAPSPTPDPPRWKLSGSWRFRQEGWNWFGSLDGADQYTFSASLLRLRLDHAFRGGDAVVELAQPLLLNLPGDASLPPPLGQLGHGAAYRDASGSREAGLLVKQAGVALRRGAWAARLGRQEFGDGSEHPTRDAKLGWIRRERLAQRLLGPFGFTHVGRSFDGLRLDRRAGRMGWTLLAALPTEGVFELDGGSTLEEMPVLYLSATRPFGAAEENPDGWRGDGRLFGLYLGDHRDAVVKTDNRALPIRTADGEPIDVGTVGGHLSAVRKTRAVEVDVVLWGAAQFGDWGGLSHRAHAFAVEAGLQPGKGRGSPRDARRPWLRAGYQRYSGDSNPADGRHGSFLPGLNTPRIYARFPFYTLSNLEGVFVQAILWPSPQVEARFDVHFLQLDEAADLWYAGGGAFQREPVFGYGGRPSGGRRRLATLLDASVDYRLRPDTTVSLYLGYALGGAVIEGIYGGSGNGGYGYLELTRRW